MEVNTCENSNFHMPNYVLSKAATPMNLQFERTKFTSKFCTDFGMQKSFKDRSTRPDISQYQFIEHFTLKERCMAKSIPAFDENPQLSKYAAWQTQYLGEILHIQRQMFVKRCNFYM